LLRVARIYGSPRLVDHHSTPVADAATIRIPAAGGFFTVIRNIRPGRLDTDPGEAGEIVIKGPSRLRRLL